MDPKVVCYRSGNVFYPNSEKKFSVSPEFYAMQGDGSFFKLQMGSDNGKHFEDWGVSLWIG